MKVCEYLDSIKDIIEKNNKEIEAVKLLIMDMFNEDNILIHYHDELSPEQIKKLDIMVNDYAINSKPVQYILGYSYFYGEKFKVNSNTLIPRFDTEVVVEEAIRLIEEKLKNQNALHIVDVGTGSGIIAITIKKHFKSKVIVDAIDISSDALDVAKENALFHNTDINFICNDLLNGISTTYDVIISNPPYIDKTEYEMKLMGEDVKSYEPPLALYADDKGMHFYIEILKQSFHNLSKFGIIIYEIGYNQEMLMNEVVQTMYPRSTHYCLKDYNNNPRCYVIKNEV